MRALSRRQALAGVASGMMIVKPETAFGYQANSAVSYGVIGTGGRGVYVGTHPSTAQQAVDAIHEELALVTREGLSGDALAEAKQQVKGQVTLSLESPGSRMYRLAGVSLFDEPYRPVDKVLAEIDSITADDVQAVASEFFSPERQTMVWLGPQ